MALHFLLLPKTMIPIFLDPTVEGDLLKMNASLKEVKKAPRRRKCDAVCIKVEWNEVVIQDDYRNVAFYIVSYREV